MKNCIKEWEEEIEPLKKILRGRFRSDMRINYWKLNNTYNGKSYEQYSNDLESIKSKIEGAKQRENEILKIISRIKYRKDIGCGYDVDVEDLIKEVKEK